MTVMILQRSKLKPGCAHMTFRRANSTKNSSYKAMRYYRLWIYTCNAVLLVSVLGFAVVAGRIVVADPRRQLVSGLSLYQPSFLYAYLALATQSGLLQVIGCLGAIKLNERLLNVYWLLLLVLLFGDAIVGIVWVFRFDKICADLRPTLKQRLAAEYGVDADFTMLWDALQRDYRCCGVNGAQDYDVVNRTGSLAVPQTSSSTVTTHISTSTQSDTSDWWSTLAPKATKYPQINHAVPESCCVVVHTRSSPTNVQRIIAALRTNHTSLPYPASNDSLSHVIASESTTQQPPVLPEHCGAQMPSKTYPFHIDGCERKLITWLRHSADVLFVLGYCVIAFVKLCFVGILRYEIKEMIQKIKILHGEMRPPQLLLTELGGSPAQPVANATSAPPGGGAVSPPAANRVHETNNGAVHATPLRHLAALADGNDSDTNSNCALIISEDQAPSVAVTRPKQARSSNGNNNYELHELQELNRLISRHQTEI